MQKSLIERLSIDADSELCRIIDLFRTGKAPVFYAGMDDLFIKAKRKDEKFKNHAPVLAISIGGTNIKLMLASMYDGSMVVHHTRGMGVPQKKTGFKEFFDDLLINDKAVYNYLKSSKRPAVGISFPMAVIGDIAYHPTKVPMLDGVIARDFERDSPTHNFRENFQDYLKANGFNQADLFFQGDGIVAHHGAVSISDVGQSDKTTLIICGTGLALGDEMNYLQVGIMPLNDNDEELYPHELTEDHQLHYAVAGKGIFALMERAIRIESLEPDSALGGCNLSEFFKSSVDTKLVADIMKTALGEKHTDRTLKILELVGDRGFAKLQQLAHAIMKRTVLSIANSIVSVIVKMGPAENGSGHKVYFEGSICNDSYVLPKVKKRVRDIINNQCFFEKIGVPVPFQPDMEVSLHALKIAENLAAQLNMVDITLVGAASMIIAYTSDDN